MNKDLCEFEFELAAGLVIAPFKRKAAGGRHSLASNNKMCISIEPTLLSPSAHNTGNVIL